MKISSIAGLLLILHASYIIVDGNLFQFCGLINHYQGRSGLYCLRYNNYGCWCGIGGKGNPLDATDRCCKAHDLCYKRIHFPCFPKFTFYWTWKGRCCKYKLFSTEVRARWGREDTFLFFKVIILESGPVVTFLNFYLERDW